MPNIARTLLSNIFRIRRSDPPMPPPGPIHVNDVFSTTVFAPLSYIDRSTASSDKTTKDKISRLRGALRQEGMIVGVYGESKTGKTMFTLKTLSDANYGFLIAEGTEIHSLDGFWRHIAEKIQLRLPSELSTSKETERASEVKGSAGADFRLPFGKLKARAEASHETRKLESLNVKEDVLNSVRQACLDFLGKYRMAVVVDDFHAIADAALRRQIISNVKQPAGLKQGKYVFIAIPEEALFVGQTDAQLIDRNGQFEFPNWSPADLKEIARKGFDTLGLGFEDQLKEKHLTYIEKNSCFNPINIQQICINICDTCRIDSSADIPAGRKISHKDIEDALGRFALQYQIFDQIIELAEKAGGKDAAEKKYKVGGVNLNVYQLVFATLCSRGAVNAAGILQKTVRDKIRDLIREPTWSISNLGDIMKRLADAEVGIEFARVSAHPKGTSHPLLYDGKKLFVVNPMLKVYLLWGYLRGLGLDTDAILNGASDSTQ